MSPTRDDSAVNLASIEHQTSWEMKQYGFEVTAQNNTWVGFERNRPDPSVIDKSNKELAFENFLMEGEQRSEVPRPIASLYKVCIFAETEQLPAVIRTLAESAPHASYDGKMRKTSVEGAYLPAIMLYVNSPKPLGMLEFCLKLEDALDQELGEVLDSTQPEDSKLIKSRVTITQGTFSRKRKIKDSNPKTHQKIYSDDGSIYRENEASFTEKLVRAKNQIELNKAELYKDLEGLPITNRLPLLQETVLRETPQLPDIELGIRKGLVKMGTADPQGDELKRLFLLNPNHMLRDFYAPSNPYQLMEGLDTYFKRLEPFLKRMSDGELNRLCSVLEVIAFTIHPLEDGNGQTIRNLTQSILFEAGKRDFKIKTDLEAGTASPLKPRVDQSKLGLNRTLILKRGSDTDDDVAAKNMNYAVGKKQDSVSACVSALLQDQFLDNYIAHGVIDRRLLGKLNSDTAREVEEFIKAIFENTDYIASSRYSS